MRAWCSGARIPAVVEPYGSFGHVVAQGLVERQENVCSEFIDNGYKLEPRRAYDEYVKKDAKMEINLGGPLRQEFDDIAGDAVAVKSKGRPCSRSTAST